jgi:hypothetical protein
MRPQLIILSVMQDKGLLALSVDAQQIETVYYHTAKDKLREPKELK